MNKYLRLISGVLIGVIMAPFTACQAHTCSFTQKVESAVYLKEEATCQNRSEYYYSCTCGKQGEDYFFGPRAEHVYTEKVDSEYLLTQANVLNAAVYFKSCIWCKKKRERNLFLRRAVEL